MLTKFNEICFADEITPWWNPSDEIIASQWLLFQRKSRLDWVDSNHRPHAYQACALTTWATIQYRAGSFPLSLSLMGMEMMGFEPMTPCLQGRCSPNWATPPYVLRFAKFRFFPSSLFQKIPQNWTMKQRLPILNSFWWVRKDSNLRPPPYQDDALTDWATDPKPIQFFSNFSTIR